MSDLCDNDKKCVPYSYVMLAALTNKFEAVLQNQLGDIAVAQQGFRVQLQQFFFINESRS